MNRICPYLIFTAIVAGFLLLAWSAKSVWAHPVDAVWMPGAGVGIVSILIGILITWLFALAYSMERKTGYVFGLLVGIAFLFFGAGILDSQEVEAAPVPASVQRWLPDVERHILTIWGSRDWVALHGAVIERESSGRPDVGSRAGAVGLLQIMPATFRELRQQYPGHGSDRRDPQTSMALGLRYMHRQYKSFMGLSPCQQWQRTLASYNCGLGCVSRRIRQYGDGWAARLPRETRHYIEAIPGRVPPFIRAGWPGVVVC